MSQSCPSGRLEEEKERRERIIRDNEKIKREKDGELSVDNRLAAVWMLGGLASSTMITSDAVLDSLLKYFGLSIVGKKYLCYGKRRARKNACSGVKCSVILRLRLILHLLITC
jgi:hypothetical protein